MQPQKTRSTSDQSSSSLFWQRRPVFILTATLCGVLWGSAHPCIKIGYAWFRIASDDIPGQLFFAGVRFFLAGVLVILAGSRLTVLHPASLLLILYMAFISSCAYTLWGVLLKYNPVSRVSMFTFVTPVAGVILSALLLRESQAVNAYTLIALLLICIGIRVVFGGEERHR